MSDMADLRREFLADQEMDTSIAVRTNLLASKKTLDPEELPIRAGIGLLPEDRTNSQRDIDPFKSLSKVLRNANDLNELHVTWLALSTRVGLAQRNLDKYESEYAASRDEDILLSPLSTNPEVYEVFPRNWTDISDINYLFNHVPHLRELHPTMYDPKVEWLPDKLQAPAYLA
ncbi:hypothetical protein B0H16DRAFT_1741525 [Mycena metata]|uniref:Uncharacterized protein n=1 Tax=Mycena metata TaxID=1033252 RepID=A0AAD7HB53_9AGAR|nr:hypothetical protein B0H16DRAFT_1741525 [Mycena metata]